MTAFRDQETPIYSDLADDPDLAELVSLYVDEMPDRISGLIRCWDKQEWRELARLAHQIKGASGSYGFSQVVPYALRLEKSAHEAAPLEQIKADLDELTILCRRIRSGVGGEE